MLKKCANPGCEQQFRYWREGRLVVVRDGKRNHERLEYFWFCSACSAGYELVRLKAGGLAVRPARIPPQPAPAPVHRGGARLLLHA